jgi:hypothetical protein
MFAYLVTRSDVPSEDPGRIELTSEASSFLVCGTLRFVANKHSTEFTQHKTEIVKLNVLFKERHFCSHVEFLLGWDMRVVLKYFTNST